jgi:F420-non-reducing hydrogenase large subunit
VSERITISPITRLEGHGKIDIFLDDDGRVADCYFQVVEFRGFEKFCQGRPVEELPRITPKICGVCPGAHHMASAKALDAVYGVEIPPAARKLRELFYNAHIAHSHMLHFFALGAPDFVPGAGEPKATRNVIGLIRSVGVDTGKAVLRHRAFCQKIQGMIAGHPIHPVAALPGGMSAPLSEGDRDEIVEMAASLVAFAGTSLDLFERHVLGVDKHVDLLKGETYRHETHYAGLVDGDDAVNFYDGQVRVVDPSGGEVARFDAAEYLEHIAEHVEPWTYLKFPYLKAKGWTGMVDGPESGVYRVNSLARLNVARRMATPLADEARDRMREFFGVSAGEPVHATLAFHWARLIETLFACEEIARLASDPEITSPEVRAMPTAKPGRGVGVVEAARGTLYHDYATDGNGMVESVNLIVATVQNNAGMGMSVKKAAQDLIVDGKTDDAILDMVEMGFRAYDPCLACATHALPGLDLTVRLVRHGEVERVIEAGAGRE